MIPRRILVKGSRINGTAALSHPRANPMTLRVTPDQGAVPVTAPGLLRAELRSSRTDDFTPLATVQITDPEGAGPWDITFSGAQMNQDLAGKASRQCWLVVYLLDAAGQRDTLYTANLTLTEDGASLDSALPPDVEVLLNQSTADGLYASLDGMTALTARLATAEQAIAGLQYSPFTITNFRAGRPTPAASPLIVEFGTTVTSITFTWSRNRVPVSLSINNGVGTVSPSATSHTATVSVTADITYTITGNDGQGYPGSAAQASVQVVFRKKVYWGVSASTALNSAGVLALPSSDPPRSGSDFATSRARSFVANGGGKYLYFVVPAEFVADSDPTFKVDGFVTNAWFKSAPFQHTNEAGGISSYISFRTTTVQNGTDILVEVS